MEQIVASHDRARFEVHALSAGPNDGSDLRRRLERGFDHFHDVAGMSDAAIAARMAELSIDIAIDLGGHTFGSRTRVLAARPAPIQVAFLGFPGTLGADYIDYIVADPHVIREADRNHYTEQIIYLPDTCLPAGVAPNGVSTPTRVEAGLPPHAFVYCCFNAPHKISPPVFDSWMRILNAVPDAVLWLRDSSSAMRRNLEKEAQLREVDASRLIFAPRVPTRADHCGRLALADIFLDTTPYNAHTTAAEALYAGVPIITMPGHTFASRMAASLMHAVRLPHLIADSMENYERIAIELSGAPKILANLKAYLHQARTTAPLFDGARFCRHLEAAYTEIQARSERGEVPSPLWVQDCI